MKNWEVFRRQWSGFNLRYKGSDLDGLKKTMEDVSWDNLAGSGLNQIPPTY